MCRGEISANTFCVPYVAAVGMIGKQTFEDELKQIFGPYGILEEVTVLRHPDGNGRGCGFIKFATREQAQAAINGVNGSRTIDGCSAPIVVKFADTEKDKMQKRMQVWRRRIRTALCWALANA